AEQVVAVPAEGRLQDVLRVGATSGVAIEPLARDARAEEEIVFGIVEERRHARLLAECVEYLGDRLDRARDRGARFRVAAASAGKGEPRHPAPRRASARREEGNHAARRLAG